MQWRDSMERAKCMQVLGGRACDMYRGLWDECLQCVNEGRAMCKREAFGVKFWVKQGCLVSGSG